jgi:hypothetical protein
MVYLIEFLNLTAQIKIMVEEKNSIIGLSLYNNLRKRFIDENIECCKFIYIYIMTFK